MQEANKKIKELDAELKKIKIEGVNANKGNESFKDEVKRNVMTKIDSLMRDIK